MHIYLRCSGSDVFEAGGDTDFLGCKSSSAASFTRQPKTSNGVLGVSNGMLPLGLILTHPMGAGARTGPMLQSYGMAGLPALMDQVTAPLHIPQIEDDDDDDALMPGGVSSAVSGDWVAVMGCCNASTANGSMMLQRVLHAGSVLCSPFSQCTLCHASLLQALADILQRVQGTGPLQLASLSNNSDPQVSGSGRSRRMVPQPRPPPAPPSIRGVPGKVCAECAATQTPQWREGPTGKVSTTEVSNHFQPVLWVVLTVSVC